MFSRDAPFFIQAIAIWLILLFAFTNDGQGQFTMDNRFKSTPTLKISKTLLFDSALIRYPSFSVEPYLFVNRNNTTPAFYPVMPFDANYNFKNLGWFCKTEWKFQKISKIPLFLRLGSKSQTDFLEGKLR